MHIKYNLYVIFYTFTFMPRQRFIISLRPMGVSHLKLSYLPWLSLFDSFEYLCYRSIAIINILLFQCDYQSLTSKVYPRTERVKYVIGRYLK